MRALNHKKICATKWTQKLPDCHLDIENSGHLAITAVPIPKVTVASSALTGEGSFLLSLFLVCVVLACQITLFSLAVLHAIESIFLALVSLFRSTDIVPRNFLCHFFAFFG
jgi:hypothetical protein